jgi:hypothetical protein
MMIQCWLSQGLAGKVKLPEKVAPAASSIVSPQLALFNAVCRLPPALTKVVAPGAGVLARAVCMYVTGNCAGPSELPLVGGGGGADTGSEKALLAVLFPASVAWAMNENCPVCVVVPAS